MDIGINNRKGATGKAISNAMHIGFAFIMLFIAVSCNKDESHGSPPEIKLLEGQGITGDTLAQPGEELEFTVCASATGDDITLFYITVATDSTRLYFDTGFHSRSMTWSGIFLKGAAQEERWGFHARDRYGVESSVSVNILLDTSGSYGAVQSYQSVRMGAQDHSGSGGLLALPAGQAYFFNEAAADEQIQSLIDIIYYYGEDANTIASPGANVEEGVFPGSFDDWSAINTTRYLPSGMNEDDFLSMESDSILIAGYDESNAKRKAKNLNPGDIYLFRTQAGKLGSFLVKEVNGTIDGYVEIDIKIQE